MTRVSRHRTMAKKVRERTRPVVQGALRSSWCAKGPRSFRRRKLAASNALKTSRCARRSSSRRTRVAGPVRRGMLASCVFGPTSCWASLVSTAALPSAIHRPRRTSMRGKELSPRTVGTTTRASTFCRFPPRVRGAGWRWVCFIRVTPLPKGLWRSLVECTSPAPPMSSGHSTQATISTRCIRRLVDPNAASRLSADGLKLLNQYAHGGYEVLVSPDWFPERPRTLLGFLPLFHRHLKRTEEDFKTNPYLNSPPLKRCC
jgi:hypothetical protein